MTNRHGAFIWYELMTTDVAAAEAFYTRVVGWTAHGFGEAMEGYRLFAAGDTDVAGLMAVPSEASGARPAWLGYVGVDDVDRSVADIVSAGGAQRMPPTDIEGVGRLAMATDPQGAAFYVMRGASEEASTAFSPQRLGHCSWNELTTSDQEAALAFYAGRFGWEKGDAMDMGEMGDYRFIDHHGETIGAAMTGSPGGPPPFWRYYFNVADIDQAADAIEKGGGTIHHGPAAIPTGDFIVIADDPQGAQFGLSGPRRRS